VEMVSQYVHWNDASMNCFAFCILVWTERVALQASRDPRSLSDTVVGNM
jgi:hypothetical protein